MKMRVSMKLNVAFRAFFSCNSHLIHFTASHESGGIIDCNLLDCVQFLYLCGRSNKYLIGKS